MDALAAPFSAFSYFLKNITAITMIFVSKIGMSGQWIHILHKNWEELLDMAAIMSAIFYYFLFLENKNSAMTFGV